MTSLLESGKHGTHAGTTQPTPQVADGVRYHQSTGDVLPEMAGAADDEHHQDVDDDCPNPQQGDQTLDELFRHVLTKTYFAGKNRLGIKEENYSLKDSRFYSGSHLPPSSYSVYSTHSRSSDDSHPLSRARYTYTETAGPSVNAEPVWTPRVSYQEWVDSLLPYTFTFNPPTTKLYRPAFTAKGACWIPYIFDFPTEFLSEIIHGYVFWVQESNGYS